MMKAAYDRRARRHKLIQAKKIGEGPPPVETVAPKKVGSAPKPSTPVVPVKPVPSGVRVIKEGKDKPDPPKPVQKTTVSKKLPVSPPVTKHKIVQQEKKMVNEDTESDIKTVLRQQQTLYDKSIKDHRRTSAWVIIVISIILVASITGFTYIIIQGNNAHKQSIEQIITRYEEEKTNIINTAFNIKNTLIGEYYIDDKKQFEDFMLIGAKTITKKYDEFAEQIRAKKFSSMSKSQMSGYLEITYNGAKLVGIDPYLLLAVDYIESEYNLKAKSSVGALGICQFMPLTAKLIANARTNYTILQVDGYDRSKLLDPVYSKKLQIRFMKHLFDTYDGRVEWVLLAYNWGPGKTTARWWKNGETVFTDLDPEQQKYATDVLRVYNKIKSNEGFENEEDG